MKHEITGMLALMILILLAFNLQRVETLELQEAEWKRTYGGASADWARALVETADGGYAVAGYTISFGAGSSDFYLITTDAEGNVQWNRTYGGTNRDMMYSMVETSDGGYAMAGPTWSFGAGSSDFWLVKVDSSGNHQWNQTYGGYFHDWAYSVVETSDGGYALAGVTVSFGAGLRDFWLVKVNSSGGMEWNKTYGGLWNEEAWSVVETSDGGYALVGFTSSFGKGSTDFWLVKTDSLGNLEWTRTYGEAKYDFGWSVVETTDGGYIIAGYTDSFGAGDYDFWLVKVDSSGIHQWNQTYGGLNSEVAYSVVQTTDGGYAVAGYTNSFGAGSSDFWLVKVDSSGNTEWKRTYGGVSADWARALVETGDGGYAVAGYTNSFGAGGHDFLLVKLAPSIPLDVNGDGTVNSLDILTVAIALGSQPGDPNWDPRTDIADPSGIINILDILIIVVHLKT